MAKTIKFNLICDNVPIRTLDDLRENFNIDDILNCYENKVLHRWLGARGYEEELRRVEAISSNKPVEIIKSLADVFEIEKDPAELEKNVYILQYRRERENSIKNCLRNKSDATAIILDYFSNYSKLEYDILEINSDMPRIKAALREIVEKHYPLYERDYRRLFYNLLNNAPMAVFAMLTIPEMRKHYLSPALQGSGTDDMTAQIPKKDDEAEILEMYSQLIELNRHAEEMLSDNLRSFKGQTEGYWKDLEPKGKKFMILKVPTNCFVRSAGITGGDLNAEQINGNFVITDGVDYKSNTSSAEVLYMEA
ncbi:MAG: hypothetical protein LBS53_02400 [Synergistaceae bacterium]|jgi:hypothetical protein|nr:hypothetical protein [Synergistaceae bacterium]